MASKTFTIILTFAAIFTSMLGCQSDQEQVSEVLANGRPVGEIRGLELVNKQIQNKLLDPEVFNSLTFRIEALAGSQILSMAGMMGQYVQAGAHHDFRGGEPNPFGLMLWHQVLANFADGLANYCIGDVGDDRKVVFDSGQTFTLNEAFAAKLKAVCQWPGGVAERRAASLALWRSLMGFGLTGEAALFRDFFAADDSLYAHADAAKRAKAMMIAMTMNPYFLLEK